MAGFEGLLTGHTLAGRYRIDEVIGRGGFAAVYRADDERLGRTVAIKVMMIAATDPDARERFRARFSREARAAASLQHPNVVTVYDFGTDPTLELDFLVMELLRGEDLGVRLARAGAPPLPQSLRILREATQGVAAGHRQGLVHRDVKPGNLFLAEREHAEGIRVCVLDFGIARVTAEEETMTRLTQAGEGFLSPGYASPEQLRGAKELGPASDVFSLGVIGYELLAGTRPFPRNRLALSPDEAAAVVPLRECCPDVPRTAADAVDRALAPDPADRFPHAGAFAAALQGPRPAPRPVVIPAPPPAPAPAAKPEPLDDEEWVEAATVQYRRGAAPPGRRPATGTRAPAPPARRPVARPHVPRAALAVFLVGSAVLAWWGWAADSAPGEGEWVTQPEPLARAADSVPAPSPDTAPSNWRPVVVPPDTPAASEQPAPPRQPPRAEEAADFDEERVASVQTSDPVVVGRSGQAIHANREGERLFDQGSYQAAEAWFRRAVETMPDNAYYRNNLGWTLFRRGQIAAAGRELETALRLDPGREIAYANLGEVRLAQGDTAAAIVAYRRFLELNTNARREQIARDKLRRIGGAPP